MKVRYLYEPGYVFSELVQKKLFEVMEEKVNKFYIYVPTEELSNLVQKKLFELGYEWTFGKSILLLNKQCLAVGFSATSKIEWADEAFYIGKNIPKVTIEELFSNPNKYKIQKKITIQGKEFNEEDVINLLKEKGLWK